MSKTKPKQQINPIANELCRLLHKKRIEVYEELQEVEKTLREANESLTGLIKAAKYRSALEHKKEKTMQLEMLLDAIWQKILRKTTRTENDTFINSLLNSVLEVKVKAD